MQERAEFTDRLRCIACRSELLETLSGGGFGDEPLRGIIANEAWGDHPLPYIEHERWCYVRCRSCGQEFHRRILAPSWMGRLYSEWETQAAMEAFVKKQSSLDGHRRRGEHFFAHALRLYRMAAVSARQPRLLDFGCGHGEFVAVARAVGIDAIGIDFAPDRARHGLVAMYSSIEDMRASGAGQEPFDVVTLFEVLEHLSDPRSTLESLAPMMRTGAVLVLETPDTTGITDLRSYRDYLAIGPLGHINGFTPESLRRMAERCGFRAVTASPYWVTTSWFTALTSSARNALAPLRRRTTQQYFLRN